MWYYVKYVVWGERKINTFRNTGGEVRLFDTMKHAETVADLLVKMKRHVGHPYHAMVMEIDTERNCVTLVKEITR